VNKKEATRYRAAISTIFKANTSDIKSDRERRLESILLETIRFLELEAESHRYNGANKFYVLRDKILKEIE